ncbi:MAG: methyltransferase [Candidatus Thalassarchaeaceae archaeon]|jgi:predicted RNA methylase|nr:methyltransferase [Candidatus Thalassarchaeaceae archaeon]MDP6703527.1 methyltransferase [Candidatus Thalassarchaeaceae archaeon]MDP7004494.1 methyltransferase [Candidatus Thalassarchaeaceae archaeon]
MRLRTLAMQLSKMTPHPCTNVDLEQYSTDGDLAARWLADIASFNDIFDGCSVVDLGSGNGVLGIGALLMGASSAILVEADEEACEVCAGNATDLGVEGRVEIVRAEVGVEGLDISSADLVITNPPWGRQIERADRPFLEAILSVGVTAHLMHNAEALHIQSIFEAAGWGVERYGEADFALPAAYEHHARERGRTRAAFWRLSPP